MSEQARPVIAMVMGNKLSLLAGGAMTSFNVGCMIYAAELADAVNKLAFEHTATDEEKAKAKAETTND